NGEGITKYHIEKDSKGWMTFKWFLEEEKFFEFAEKATKNKREKEEDSLYPDCNDFFYCENCYEEQKVVFPFDTAFEYNFRCECGRTLSVMSKDKVREIFSKSKAR
ncbi:MAG: hypothetical protein QXL16_01925, partial [Candidatus Micrarchaeaceae archaeon]